MKKILLCKWLWKLENIEGTWNQLISRKYLHNKVLSHATTGAGYSHFWQSMMEVSHITKSLKE
jgi:hypothetical protein